MEAFVATAVEPFSDGLINLRNHQNFLVEKAEEETLGLLQINRALNAESMSKLEDNASCVVMKDVWKLVS